MNVEKKCEEQKSSKPHRWKNRQPVHSYSTGCRFFLHMRYSSSTEGRSESRNFLRTLQSQSTDVARCCENITNFQAARIDLQKRLMITQLMVGGVFRNACIALIFRQQRSDILLQHGFADLARPGIAHSARAVDHIRVGQCAIPECLQGCTVRVEPDREPQIKRLCE